MPYQFNPFTGNLDEVGNTAVVGNASNDVPANGLLGSLAFMDEIGALTSMGSEPQQSRQINFEYVSDTSVRLRMRGDDGVVRTTTLTLS